jgi:hypothetical protein
METGVAPHSDDASLRHKLLQIALMISGSVRGVAKPITIVALEAHPTVGSTPADLMMSRAALLTPLPYRTNTRLQPFLLLTDPRLTEESIPDCLAARHPGRRRMQSSPRGPAVE